MVGTLNSPGEREESNNCVLDKTIKLWKVSERDKRAEGYNLKEDSGVLRDPSSITSLRVPVLKPMELMVEASPRRIFANAHTYHINSISVNSDQVSVNMIMSTRSKEKGNRDDDINNQYMIRQTLID